MANLSELKFYLTGGASNSDVTASTGGIVSSTEVLSQTGTGLTTLTGVTINNAMGNDVGDGTLTYTSTAQTLTWTPYNGTTGTAVDVSADGTYYIQGGSNGGALVVTVVAASLPSSTISNTVTIANQDQKMFVDVTKAQSDAGTTFYHCFAVRNTGTDEKKSVTIWIDTNTPGQDNIALGYSTSVTAGDAATTGLFTDTTSETTAPTAETVVYSAPTTKATGIVLGDLSGSAGSTHTRCFWVRLTVPAGVDEEYLNNYFHIGFYAKV